jgi:hypothetical protein
LAQNEYVRDIVKAHEWIPGTGTLKSVTINDTITHQKIIETAMKGYRNVCAEKSAMRCP